MGSAGILNSGTIGLMMDSVGHPEELSRHS